MSDGVSRIKFVGAATLADARQKQKLAGCDYRGRVGASASTAARSENILSSFPVRGPETTSEDISRGMTQKLTSDEHFQSMGNIPGRFSWSLKLQHLGTIDNAKVWLKVFRWSLRFIA
jgi:hypothetical protein